MSRRRMRHERPPATAAGDQLTERQQKLREAVVRSATSVDERLGMLLVHARRVGASEGDVRAVRADLVADHVRECGDLR